MRHNLTDQMIFFEMYLKYKDDPPKLRAVFEVAAVLFDTTDIDVLWDILKKQADVLNKLGGINNELPSRDGQVEQEIWQRNGLSRF